MKAILLFLLLAPRAFGAVVQIVPTTIQAFVGQTFTVDIVAWDANDLSAWQTDLQYRSAIVSVVSVVEGPFLQSAGPTFFIPGTNDPVNGTISFIADTLIGGGAGASGSGTLFSVSFQATHPGQGGIMLSNLLLLDSNFAEIPASATGASVTVTAVPEPTGLTLMLSCLVFLAFHSHSARRRYATASRASPRIIERCATAARQAS